MTPLDVMQVPPVHTSNLVLLLEQNFQKIKRHSEGLLSGVQEESGDAAFQWKMPIQQVPELGKVPKQGFPTLGPELFLD